MLLPQFFIYLMDPRLEVDGKSYEYAGLFGKILAQKSISLFLYAMHDALIRCCFTPCTICDCLCSWCMPPSNKTPSTIIQVTEQFSPLANDNVCGKLDCGWCAQDAAIIRFACTTVQLSDPVMFQDSGTYCQNCSLA